MPKQITKTVYTLAELLEMDDQKPYDMASAWMAEGVDDIEMNHVSKEIHASLDAIFKLANASCESGRLGTYEIKMNRDEAEKSGDDAVEWYESNIGNKRYKIVDGKRVGVDCPLTGICYDDNLLDDLEKSINSGYSVEDSLRMLLDEATGIWDRERDYRKSEQCLLESAEANGYMFDENGIIQ